MQILSTECDLTTLLYLRLLRVIPLFMRSLPFHLFPLFELFFFCYIKKVQTVSTYVSVYLFAQVMSLGIAIVTATFLFPFGNTVTEHVHLQ